MLYENLAGLYLKLTSFTSYVDIDLLIVVGAEVLQVTSLQAVTVREKELSRVSPDRVMSVSGTPSTTSPGDRTRPTAPFMLSV